MNHQIILSIITGSALHWFESYLTGRSFRVSRGEEVSKEHQLPRGSVLHHIHYIIGTHYTSTWFLLLNSTIDDTQLYHSFQPDNPIVAAWISGCLTNISAWMKEHHQQFNLAKTELLVFPATPTLQHDFAILLGSSKNILWWPADLQGPYCKDSSIRRIRPFQTEHAEQLLAQTLVISKLDSCNALLAGLPSCANKPWQMFQNAVAQLVSPLFISPHWIPVAAHIKFKTLIFAYRTATGSAPSYFLLTLTNLHPLQKTEICK